MIDQSLANLYSEKFENKVGGILEKYGLDVKKLDKNKKYRCPDFLITNKFGGQVLIECKYIASAGLAPDGKTHISNLDPNLPESGEIPVEKSIENEREALLEAQEQYIELIKNEPKYKGTPFVVALGYDLFANFFNTHPHNFEGLTEISSIMTLERDSEIREMLKKLPYKELLKRIEVDSNIGLPQPSVRYKVINNRNAKNKFISINFLKNPIIVETR